MGLTQYIWSDLGTFNLSKEATGDLGANGLTLASHSLVRPSQAKSRSSQSVECGWTMMCQEGAVGCPTSMRCIALHFEAKIDCDIQAKHQSKDKPIIHLISSDKAEPSAQYITPLYIHYIYPVHNKS